MGAVQWTAVVSLTLFVIVAVYHAGQVTARLSAIEQWRLEMRSDFLQIREALARLEGLLQGAGRPMRAERD